MDARKAAANNDRYDAIIIDALLKYYFSTEKNLKILPALICNAGQSISTLIKNKLAAFVDNPTINAFYLPLLISKNQSWVSLYIDQTETNISIYWIDPRGNLSAKARQIVIDILNKTMLFGVLTDEHVHFQEYLQVKDDDSGPLMIETLRYMRAREKKSFPQSEHIDISHIDIDISRREHDFINRIFSVSEAEKKQAQAPGNVEEKKRTSVALVDQSGIDTENYHLLEMMALCNDDFFFEGYFSKIEEDKRNGQPLENYQIISANNLKNALKTAIQFSNIEMAIHIINYNIKNKVLLNYTLDLGNNILHLSKMYGCYDELVEKMCQQKNANFNNLANQLIKELNSQGEVPAQVSESKEKIDAAMQEKKKFGSFYINDLRRNGTYVIGHKNETISLSLSDAFSVEELKTYEGQNRVEQLQTVSSLIEEHCARRVDLFFYTLVAFYKKGVMVELAEKEEFQHGTAPVSKHAACHSSILARFKLTPASAAANTTPRRKFFIKGSVGQRHLKEEMSPLDGTYLLDALNSTIELPSYPVNTSFDSKTLEAHLRPGLLAIINNVSLGRIDPFQGMESFFLVMEQHFFQNIPGLYLQRKATPADPLAGRKIIYEAALKGTFYRKWHITDQKNSQRDPSGYLLEDFKDALLFFYNLDEMDLKEGIRTELGESNETLFIKIQHEIYENESAFLVKLPANNPNIPPTPSVVFHTTPAAVAAPGPVAAPSVITPLKAAHAFFNTPQYDEIREIKKIIKIIEKNKLLTAIQSKKIIDLWSYLPAELKTQLTLIHLKTIAQSNTDSSCSSTSFISTIGLLDQIGADLQYTLITLRTDDQKTMPSSTVLTTATATVTSSSSSVATRTNNPSAHYCDNSATFFNSTHSSSTNLATTTVANTAGNTISPASSSSSQNNSQKGSQFLR